MTNVTHSSRFVVHITFSVDVTPTALDSAEEGGRGQEGGLPPLARLIEPTHLSPSGALSGHPNDHHFPARLLATGE